MVSIYNDIARRPHLPRDRALLRIMGATGITINNEPDGEETERTELASQASLEEEDEEEEELTDDELVDLPAGQCFGSAC